MTGPAIDGAHVSTWRILVGDRDGLGAGVAVPDGFGDQAMRWRSDGDPVLPDGVASVDWCHLICQSAAWLKRFLASAEAEFRVRRTTITIERWNKPHRDWSGRIGPLPRLVRQSVRMPSGMSGRVHIDLAVSGGTSMARVIAAVLEALVPRVRAPRMISSEFAIDCPPPVWLNTSAQRLVRPLEVEVDPHTRPYDVLLTRTDPPTTVPEGADVLQIDAVGVRSKPAGNAILVDAAFSNPIGRRPETVPRVATLRFDPGSPGDWRVVVHDAGEVIASGRLGQLPLDIHQRHALDSVGTLIYEPGEGADPASQAALLVHLSSMGLLLHADRLPAPVASLLSPELVSEIHRPLPGTTAEPLEWEIRRVRQTRAAHRGHATAFHLETLAGTPYARPPAVSALLVTRRSDFVADAVAAIAGQTYPELEIIVGLHGIQLDDATRAGLGACGRPVQVVDIDPSRSFGEALTIVTSRAQSELVTKVDDDDIYGSEHVWDLVVARNYSGATVVGKGAEFVYLGEIGMTVRRSAMASECYSSSVAGGTILIAKGDLAATGGWRPIPRGVDRGLFERIQHDGGLIYRTHSLGYVLRRHTGGHTWEPGLEYFLRKSGPQWQGLPPFEELVGTV